VDISFTVCLLFVCTVTYFAGEDKTIAASNFAQRLIGVEGRKSPTRREASELNSTNGLSALFGVVRVTLTYRQYHRLIGTF